MQELFFRMGRLKRDIKKLTFAFSLKKKRIYFQKTPMRNIVHKISEIRPDTRLLWSIAAGV